MKSSLRAILSITIVLLAPLVFAQDQAMKMSDTAPLTTELVMELKVNISAPVNVGESDSGSRRFIPITGGEFVGKDIQGEVLQGEVLNGGADWQLTRPDGVTEVKAIYAIKTSDGAVIEVDNRGVATSAEDGRYIRTAPTFKAPQGKYDWLNKRLFVGTITPGRGYVTIRVFLVN